MTRRDIKMLLALSCEEASRLASAALDGELSWSERWALRVHGVLCRSCRRMVRQLKRIRAFFSNMPEISQQQLREKLPRLSAERRQRIKQLLREAGQAESG